MTIYLNKQQALDADAKETQQISFTRNLDRDVDTTMCFIIKEAKSNFRFLIWYKMTQYNTLNVKSSNSQLNKL